MFQFIGYDFFAGPNALNTAPGSIDNITITRLTNAIFDHFNITKNTSLIYNDKIPEGWDYDTILNADLNGDLDAGNVDFIIEQLSAIKIKRRIRGTFNWITLETVPIDDVEDLTFVFNDRLNAYGVEYEYAFVPVLQDVESEYIMNSILSKFNGVFIGDYYNTYKFLYDVNYGNNSRNQQIGTFQPLGRKYPVIVNNGLLSYESGSVSAKILNDNYQDTGIVDAISVTKKKNVIKDFLTNHKAKILKDWCGNIWLCMIVDSPQVSYANGSGMSIPVVSFNWTEIGDVNSQQDLYLSGVIDEPSS